MPRAKKESLTKTCIHCKNRFSTRRCNQKFCTPECNSTYHQEERKAKRHKANEKRLLKKSNLFDQTAFAAWLVSECKRAGTVQILSLHTSETFLQLLQLRKDCTRYSGFEDGKPTGYYELSHIQPVRGKYEIGLLHPSNLVISTKTYNRKRSSKQGTTGAGLAIPMTDLLTKWEISNETTKAQVLRKIKALLGKEILDSFYLQANLNRNTRNQLIYKITKTDTSANRNLLNTLSLEQLTSLAESKSIKTPSIPDREHLREFHVFKLELERLNITNTLAYSILSSDVIFRCFLDGSEEFFLNEVQNTLHCESTTYVFDSKSIVDYLTLNSFCSPVTPIEEYVQKLDNQHTQKQRELDWQHQYLEDELGLELEPF